MAPQADVFPFLQKLLVHSLKGEFDGGSLPDLAQLLRTVGPQQSQTSRNMSYVDESGHGRDPNRNFVCLAGLLTTESAWKNFDSEWRAVLDGERLKEPFHATDLCGHRRKGQFRGWKKERRQRFLEKLIETIRRANVIPVGSVVSIKDFSAFERRQMRGTKLRLKDPHYAAFQQVTLLIVHAAQTERWPVPIKMIYAHHPEHSDGLGGVNHLWETMRKTKPKLVSAFMGEYAAGDPRDDVRLQAADLWAYELGHHFEVVRPAEKEPDYAFKQFVNMGLNYSYYDHDFITYAGAHGVSGIGPLSRFFGKEISLYKSAR